MGAKKRDCCWAIIKSLVGIIWFIAQFSYFIKYLVDFFGPGLHLLKYLFRATAISVLVVYGLMSIMSCYGIFIAINGNKKARLKCRIISYVVTAFSAIYHVFLILEIYGNRHNDTPFNNCVNDNLSLSTNKRVQIEALKIPCEQVVKSESLFIVTFSIFAILLPAYFAKSIPISEEDDDDDPSPSRNSVSPVTPTTTDKFNGPITNNNRSLDNSDAV